MIKRFIARNISAADFIEDRLPRAFTRSLMQLHQTAADRLMNSDSGLIVVDVGGGHLCPFAALRRPEKGTLLIATDILFDQLRKNSAVDARVACDACGALPFRDQSVDLIVTRSVLEHLPDNGAFAAECRRVLKRGGRVVHLFPTRRAPFAILNRLLPGAIVRRAMFYCFPQWADECGFRAYYAACAYPEMVRLFERNGFSMEDVQLRYYQSIYFKPFLPLYLLSLAYDLLLWSANCRPLCSQILLIARRD